MSQLHLVTGAGPVGWNVAEQLAERGHRVRVLTRSGSGPDHPQIERRRVDVSDPAAFASAIEGATAIYHCTHGSAYSAKAWRAELPAMEQVVLEAAGRIGAVVVFPESLYSFGKVDAPMTEDTPRSATTGKLGIRAELLRAREDSATATISVAASDFFGPHVRGAHAGERMVPTIMDGKTMRVIGSLDQPHSFTYVPDLAAAMVTAAAERDLWNSFLFAPTSAAVTQRQLIETFAAAAGVPAPKCSAIPAWAMDAVGFVHADTRELAETAYQFARPFVMDSRTSERLLDLAPTPLADAAAETVRWWQGLRAAA
ncbi:NAD-dependent epimerase/dehydratase family protein [Aldersonia kunmingensis]|uniref:NAD-dependent epimerase/dehydratase family protein n=1 Tax=Aldersonia kunmingensis TaxID=408066 RepID=UPI00082F72D2|nr:NAD-dependent epimerase/dehydratase family protein [Aldersonia kunmingensis]